MIAGIWLIITTFVPYVISFGILILLIVLASKKIAEVRWAKSFILTFIAVMVWIIGDIAVQVAFDPTIFNLGGKIMYTGIVATPYFWLLFIISYSGHHHWLNNKRIILLAIIPIGSLAFMYSDYLSQYMRVVDSIDKSGSLILYTTQYGPWFWVHTSYSYLMLLIAEILLIQSTLATSKLFVGQKILLIIASLFPWVANILYVTRITGNIDYSTVAFTALAVALMFNFIKFKFMNIGPIARGIIFENMVDPVIVLDKSHQIIDLNPPAALLKLQNKSIVLGQSFEAAFPEFNFLLNGSHSMDDLREGIGIPEEDPKNFYSVRINAISDKQTGAIGKVIVLRNINDQVSAKNALLNINQELEKHVNERTKDLQKELKKNQLIQQALRESDERYSLAIQGANDGIWDWDLSSGKVFYSSRWKSILGYKDSEVPNTIGFWLEKVHGDDSGSLQIELSRHLDNKSDSFEHSHRLACKDGSYLWVQCRGMAKRDSDGVAIRISGSLTDISRQKQFEEQILFDAFHDHLTGLSNRAFIMDRISHSIERAKRSDRELFALIFLDLDRFKNVNDSLGHSVGDILLQTIAKRLKKCLRNIDTLSRLGGDEFVILIDSLTGVEEITVISNRIIESITQKMTLSGSEVSITASMGIVIFSDQYKNASEIISDADIAMYQAKRNTIRRYEIFNNEMRQKVEARLRVETEIHRAIQSNEFELFYQPILRVKDQSLESFEALIRWNKPGKGYINPIDFIPIAEETGLILPIGHWVLKEACKQIAAWISVVPPDNTIVVNVNLSARQFLDPQLCTQIWDCMNEFQIEGKNLILEITETAIIEEKEKAINTLKELRGWGIQIHIDDFGTGFSSLSYLHSLPFDALKIDRSFVAQMCVEDNSTGIDIIQTIISLGKDLKKDVIAEGVETQKELDILTKMGCNSFQGYLISKPVNKEAASEYLANEINKSSEPEKTVK